MSGGRVSREIRVVDFDSQWPERFAEVGLRLRTALGDIATRIDHIGSTAVPGLVAKPVIDVQISVAALEPVAPFEEPLERLGFVYREDNQERTKRYSANLPASRERTSTDVGQAPSPSSSHSCSASTCAYIPAKPLPTEP